MSTTPSSASLHLTAALAYTSCGWPVLPLHAIRDGRCSCHEIACNSPGKHPLTSRGLNDATSDDATLRGWWGRHPDANIGIVTGAVSNLVVLDIDPAHGGRESLTEMERLHGALPRTIRAYTGGRGWHYYFRHPSGLVPNRVGVAPGIDVRGDGGYCVAPGSQHSSGRIYKWHAFWKPPRREPAHLPPWLLELIRVAPSASTSAPLGVPAEGVAIQHGERNASLYRLGRSMHSKGCSTEEIRATLRNANTRCTPPLAPHEVEDIARKAATQPDRPDFAARRDDLGPRSLDRPAAAQSSEGVRLTPVACIRPEPVEWAWANRIPLGALSLLVGDPGGGKSTLTIELAGRASQGQLPGDLIGTSAAVALVTAEDAVAQVVRPRLEAAGADLDCVHIVSVERDGVTGGLVLPEDMADLTARLREHGVRLLIVDPIVAHLPGTIDAHKDQHVRRALAPLARLAEDLQLAVVGIVHLNKSTDTRAVGRVSGSVGFVGAARSVLLLAPDRNGDSATRLLVHWKCNFGPLAPTLRFRLESRTVATEGKTLETSGIEWQGDAPGISADDVLVQGVSGATFCVAGGRRRDPRSPRAWSRPCEGGRS